MNGANALCRILRWILGFALVSACGLVSLLCHYGILAGAWLMDREDATIEEPLE